MNFFKVIAEILTNSVAFFRGYNRSLKVMKELNKDLYNEISFLKRNEVYIPTPSKDKELLKRDLGNICTDLKKALRKANEIAFNNAQTAKTNQN